MALARAMGWSLGIVTDIVFITFAPLIWTMNLYGPGAGQNPAPTWVWVLMGVGLVTIAPLWFIGPVAGPHPMFSHPLRRQPEPAAAHVSITRGTFTKLPLTPTPPPPPDYSVAPGQVFETPRRDPGERYLVDE